MGLPNSFNRYPARPRNGIKCPRSSGGTTRRSRRDRIPNALGRWFPRFRYTFAPPAVAGAIGAALGRLSVVVGASDLPLCYFSRCFLGHVGLLVAAIDSRRAIPTIGPGADPFGSAHIV